MSVKGCIGVAEFGTVDDNFVSVNWLGFIDVSYNPPISQTTYEARGMHSISLHIVIVYYNMLIVNFKCKLFGL